MGTVPINLPLVRTAELQLSMSFSNLAVPAIGGMAAQIRFLQKQGVDLASAVASGGLLINVGNIVAQVMLLGVAVLLAPTAIHVDPIDTQKLVTLVLLVIVLRGDRRRPRARHPEAAQLRGAADEGRGGDAVGGGALTAPGRCSCWAATRSTRSCTPPSTWLHRRVRRVDQLLDAAVAQHHHLDARVARPDPRRQHRGVVGRHVGRARRGGRAHRASRWPPCSPTSW